MSDTTWATSWSASSLGWRTQSRPAPALSHALGAAAGALVVAAMIAVVAEIGGDVSVPGALFSLGLAGAAYVAGRVVPGPARSACMSAVAFCVPLFFVFAFLGGGSASKGDLTAVFGLTALVFVVCYLLVGTRGRAVFLGLALLFGWLFVLNQVGNNALSSVTNGTSITTPFGGSSGTSTAFGSTSGGSQSDAGAASLVVGIGFLVGAVGLDRRRLAGAATPFVLVGAIATIVGAVDLGSDSSNTVAGILVAAAGLVVGLVGAHGKRRASTWAGAVTVLVGLLVLIADLAGDSRLGFAALALVCAAGLLAIAIAAGPRLHEPAEPVPERGSGVVRA